MKLAGKQPFMDMLNENGGDEKDIYSSQGEWSGFTRLVIGGISFLALCGLSWYLWNHPLNPFKSESSEKPIEKVRLINYDHSYGKINKILCYNLEKLI